MCVHSLIDTNRIDASLVWWIYTPFPYYSHTDHTHSLFTCSISSFLFLAVLFSLTFVLMPMNYSYSPSVYLFARAFDAELACLASSLLRPVRLPSSGPTLGVANRNSRVVLPSWIRIESVVVVARFHLESGESSTPFPLLFSRVSSSLRLSSFGSQMSSFSCRWLPIGIGTDETNPSTHQQKKEKKEIQRERGGDTIWKSKGLRDVKGGGSRLNKQKPRLKKEKQFAKSPTLHSNLSTRIDLTIVTWSLASLFAVNVAFFKTQFYLRNLLYIF